LDDSSIRVIPVICGPTGAGKTRVAHWLAARESVGIISADSRQVYSGFDVGTAKPTRAERSAIPYHGLDVLGPTQRASAAWWAEHADQWIDDVLTSGRSPVIVGGTGLYLRALFAPLFEEPELDPVVRAGLERELASYDTGELRRWVQALDPERTRFGRTQLLRAIEIALLTGRRLSDLHRAHARPALRRARYLVVDPGARLREDLAERTREMLASGWRDEVRHLMTVVPPNAPAWNGTGYRTIRDLEEGLLTLAAAETRIVTDTRQYAKRQRTWFRHQLSAEQVTLLDPYATDWMDRAAAWWRGQAS
jgi:tRNA dimethylallyltransferase